MRRLFSTFAEGLPGLGLVLIRLVVGVPACAHGIGLLGAGEPPTVLLVAALHLSLGALVILGLWTPLACALVALTAIADAYTHPELRCCCVLVAAVAVAAALIGPGKWSIDARLFGWKRLEIRDRKRP